MALRKVIKGRSIGERTQLLFDSDGGRSVRENFGKEDRGALTQEDNLKLQRRETRDFGGGTPYNSKFPWEPCHLTSFSQ